MNDDRTEGLAGRAAGEEPRAFEALVQRLYPRLQVWISLRMGHLLRGRLAVDDVLQETLIQVHKSLATFRDQGPNSFQRWMFTLADNRLRDLRKYHSAQRRDAARERPSDEELAFCQRVAAQTTPSSRTNRNELVARLERSIRALPDEDRDLVVLRALEERTFKEIAAQTGLRHAAVVARYGRALQALKRDLAELNG